MSSISAKKDIGKRTAFLFAVFLTIGLVVVVRILYLQFIVGFSLRAQEEQLTSKRDTVMGERGAILANDGRYLAYSMPYYRIKMDVSAKGLKSELLTKNIDSLSLCLSRFFKDRSAAGYKNYILSAYRSGRGNIFIGNRRVNYVEYKYIKQFPLYNLNNSNRSGFLADETIERVYPYGMMGLRTIGKVSGRFSQGITGIELSFNKALGGKAGIVENRRIGRTKVPFYIKEPKKGSDIITSLDIELQDCAHNALYNKLVKTNAYAGCAVLMETKTGFVKAISNLSKQSDGSYAEDLNYAIGVPTEPGSTFKLMSFIIGLEDGKMDLNATVNTGNGKAHFYDADISDSHEGGYGTITYREVFEKSSNIGTARFFLDNYKGKEQRFLDYLEDMHLMSPLGLDIIGERKPYFPSMDDKRMWSGISVPWMAVGYGQQISPMQTLAFYNAIANDGIMVKPRFIKGYRRDKSLDMLRKRPYVLNSSVCSRATLKTVRGLLEGVVERGTATNLQSKDYKIAGKTGTAQIAQNANGYHNKSGQREYQASFCGYFPADDPQYSCIVVIYGPQGFNYYGNTVAGPVFKEISDKVYYNYIKIKEKYKPTEKSNPTAMSGYGDDVFYALDEHDVEYDNNSSGSDYVRLKNSNEESVVEPQKIVSGLVPNVVGMGAVDAVYLLEKEGIRVRMMGVGKVRSQSVTPGTRIVRGREIVLKLS